VEKRVVPGLYNAKVNGEWYFSTRLPSLRSAIDAALARKDARKPGKEQGDPVNSSVYIAPKAAVHAQAALRGYLEWQTHQRAVGNEPLWLALYRSGVLPPDATRETAEAAAWKWLGFVPVSPDGAAYRYEARTMTVANTRHGSLRYPRLHATLAEDSPVLRLLGQLQTIQANLRFREDGIHTVLAITRAPRK
jgi:hypothetical protein